MGNWLFGDAYRECVGDKVIVLVVAVGVLTKIRRTCLFTCIMWCDNENSVYFTGFEGE